MAAPGSTTSSGTEGWVVAEAGLVGATGAVTVLGLLEQATESAATSRTARAQRRVQACFTGYLQI